MKKLSTWRFIVMGLITLLMMWITGLLSVLGMYCFLRMLFGTEIPALIGAWAFNFSPSR